MSKDVYDYITNHTALKRHPKRNYKEEEKCWDDEDEWIEKETWASRGFQIKGVGGLLTEKTSAFRYKQVGVKKEN